MKAKFKTNYEEAIYPGRFRWKREQLMWMPVHNPHGYMPVMLTGWVQNEVHVQWGYQSLQ